MREMEWPMKKRFMQCAAFLLCALLLLQGAAAAAPGRGSSHTVRIGLYYGQSALPAANLQNYIGSGYAFGYFNEDGSFTSVGSTWENKLTMLKTQVMYLSTASGVTYSDTVPAGSYTAIGVYHLQSDAVYESYEDAAAAAGQLADGFPAWIDGTYRVRSGAYVTAAEAEAALAQSPVQAQVVWTSKYSVNVVATGSAKLLFQFDGGSAHDLTVQPLSDGGEKTQTWFKGYKYYGNFTYSRKNSENLTVINNLPMEDYVKGVLPYEMSASWPREALKAQAVCARTYAAVCTKKHTADGFDLCATDNCQVYHGTNSATANSDAAVDETAGVYAWYNGSYAETYFFSSDGGGTESVWNVWSGSKKADYPYLTGVQDPYEGDLSAGIQNYNWTVTYSGAELGQMLRAGGYSCTGDVTAVSTVTTATGNVFSVTFTDSAGRTYTISYGAKVRTFLSLRSIRFAVSTAQGSGAAGGSYAIDSAGNTVSSTDGLYAVDSSGAVSALPGSGVWVITGNGKEALSGANAVSGTSFTFKGSGWGHNIGMSQWGANAMAQRGLGYEAILKFYYTGITLQTLY